MNFESLKPARPGPITLLFSLWLSFVLPRQVVKPLINLREAVDHADLGTSKHVGRASLRKSSLCCGSARSMSSAKEWIFSGSKLSLGSMRFLASTLILASPHPCQGWSGDTGVR